MTKREEYKLEFVKFYSDIANRWLFKCNFLGDANSSYVEFASLAFMDRIDKYGIIDLIGELSRYEIDNSIVPDVDVYDWTGEDDVLVFSNGDINIQDGGYLISVSNLKELLEEWLEFLNS